MIIEALKKRLEIELVDNKQLFRRALFGSLMALSALLLVEQASKSYGSAGPGVAHWVVWLATLLAGYRCLRHEVPGGRVWVTLKMLLGALIALAILYQLTAWLFGAEVDQGRAHFYGVLAVMLGLFLLWGPRVRHGIERPDVLGGQDNLKDLPRALALGEHGVFCGEIQAPAGRENLYVSAEDRGVVIGPPGTGKTAFMLTQLLDWSERNGSFVCLDIKPELHDILRPSLERAGYRVLVLNPTAPVDCYNFLDDISGTTAIGELAASLVPATGDDARAFDEGARDILDGIISYLRAEGRPVSLPSIRTFLADLSSERELIKMLASSTDPDVREIAFALSRSAANARFMGSVFATLRANLRFLRHEAIRTAIDRSDFSLELFRQDRPVALFLQFEERHQQTTRLLLCALIAHLLNWFIEHTDRDPVLLMLDEIGNVPRVPGLVEKLNTIRSRRLPTWLYWQGLQQMQKYGVKADEGPSSILAACDFQMAFRLNDNDTARWFSERLGTVDRTSTTLSEPAGGLLLALLDDRASVTSTTGTVEEPIMKISDLQSLPPGECVAAYRGRVWRNRATPYFERWPAMARKPPASPMPERV